MAQPFDAGRKEPVGDPAPVAENVDYTEATQRGQFSVSGNAVLVYTAPGAARDTQLTWMDRNGKTISAIDQSPSFSVALSPDESRIAVDRNDVKTSNWDIWVLDPSRKTNTRITFEASAQAHPFWSADGSRLVYGSQIDGKYSIVWKDAGGAGKQEQLFQGQYSTIPLDLSKNGRHLLYRESNPKTKSDLWTMALTGERTPMPFAQSEFAETEGRFSPDSRWIAYTSDESSRNEIYVQPFPPTGAKWQISNSGGTLPRWRQDGRELFYVAADNKLMAVEIRAGARLEAGVPKVLFELRGRGPYSPYAVARNGQQFLVSMTKEQSDSPPLNVILNWNAKR